MCSDIGCCDWCYACLCPHCKAASIEQRYGSGCFVVGCLYCIPCYGFHIRPYIDTEWSCLGTWIDYSCCYATALIHDERTAELDQKRSVTDRQPH